MTIAEIAAEHGVSRQTVHSYRRGGTFPRPVPAEGTTKQLFRADEVADWFSANPKQQGKRTDLPAKQGESPVPGQQTEGKPLSDDARAILRITWEWIIDANNGEGGLVGDLQHDLERSGYGCPPDLEDDE